MFLPAYTTGRARCAQAAPAGPAPSLAMPIRFEPNSSRVRAESGPLLPPQARVASATMA